MTSRQRLLYQNFSLQLAFPPHNSYTLCVSDNTLIKVIHKHNIRTALLPLLAWGFRKLFWTFSISLPAFSPDPSNGSSRDLCEHDSLQQQFLPCFLVTCHNNICNNFHALRMKFYAVGRQCILHSTYLLTYLLHGAESFLRS